LDHKLHLKTLILSNVPIAYIKSEYPNHF